MPVLERETDTYPEDLLEFACNEEQADMTETTPRWWAMYTLSRREKPLMRRLLTKEIPFCAPVIPKRQRSPSGRMRISHIPLFTSYVFVYGDELQRYEAVSTGCVSRNLEVYAGSELTRDLYQVQTLIQAGVPLTAESRLGAGRRVRVRSGPFRGYEGMVIRREGQTRLLVAVNFLQQGASMLLDDCELEILG